MNDEEIISRALQDIASVLAKQQKAAAIKALRDYQERSGNSECTRHEVINECISIIHSS